MSHFKTIQSKLEAFIRRFYTNELLKGTILFFTIGLLYFLFTLFIEHVLWLNTTARTVLFWLFVAVELGLLIKFVFIPLAKLFKLQKGIDYEAASKIIGKHFPEVNDKLLNVLQLHQSNEQSELLFASIEQKSMALTPVPFKLAVNFKRNLGYLKYAAIPVVILLLTFVSGNFNWFSDSYQRVVHYKTAYEPPAPFQFFVVNGNLNAIEHKDFKLIVKTAGEVVPETAQINYNNETYFLQQKAPGEFEYVFSQLGEPVTFQLSANTVTSKPYTVNVVETPSLLDFKMVLDYPNYTKKQDEILNSTGNAVVPEGTKITWKLQTKSTDEVFLFSKDTVLFITEKSNQFEISKQVFSNFDYSLSTSNQHLKHYENLGFNIDVVKDQYPEINVEMKQDSLDMQTLYFRGQVSDDYGFSKLQLVYYPINDENNKQEVVIPVSNSNISEFISAFPNEINIEAGVAYEMYFQVFDNDAVNRFKSAKSALFTYRKRTQDEEEQRRLKEQGETIQDLNKSLEKFDEQEKELNELTQTQKEKSDLNFNDKKKLESFFKRQKQQDEMMKHFNQKLKDNLEEFQKENPNEDEFKEALKERLKENEEKLKKDERLLKEIEKLQDKISQEELINKLDDLAKQNKNKKRSLEQLLELTKRFYVEKKLEKLRDDLEKLSDEQDEQINKPKEENTKEKQDELNEKFEEYKQEMDALEKESNQLKKPIDIPRDKLDEKEVDAEQQKAADELDQMEQQSPSENEENSEQNKSKESLQKAKQSQKKAAQKMKQMSEQMKGAMQAGGGEQMQEDMETLRQILDNLVLFSFDQEALMNQFKTIESSHNKYASYLVKQNNLKEHFEHVDDSLFALSLRQTKISEKVNKEITDVYYNIDKAMTLLAENQMYQGISNQQFAVTSANNLADILSDILDSMQESLSMSAGKGGQGDMQLPDIIMSQEQLNKMMQQGMKKGEQGKPKEGEGKQQGQGDNESEKEGEEGSKGKNGEQQGEGGKQSVEGEGSNEDMNGLLYEIYQQQQQLRNELEEKIKKEGLGGNGDALVRKMENIELELLNKGFTNQTLQKMMDLKHQLLKMQNATHQQGEEERRESESNKKQFSGTVNNQIPTAKEYFQTTEILNKQALPLQPVYKEKVQKYFKQQND
ncbi:DUF4175 family protein [Tamlana crocina]